jgi:hypothetical protein
MKKLKVVCATIVLLAGIGAMVYIQKQSIAQKDRMVKNQQELEVKKLKYQQCETNNREASAHPTIANSFNVKNCDLIL